MLYFTMLSNSPTILFRQYSQASQIVSDHICNSIHINMRSLFSAPIPPESPPKVPGPNILSVIQDKIKSVQAQKHATTYLQPSNTIKHIQVSLSLAPPHQQETDQQKQLLISTLELTQARLRQSDEVHSRQKQALKNKMARLELDLKKANDSKALALKNSMFTTDAVLLKNLEKLEKVTTKREQKFHQESEKYKKQIETLQQQLKSVQEGEHVRMDSFSLSKGIASAIKKTSEKNENRSLRAQLQALTHISQQKEAELNMALQKLSANNRFIAQAQLNREQSLIGQISQLQEVNDQLQREYNDLGQQYKTLVNMLKEEQESSQELFTGLCNRFEGNAGSTTFKSLSEEYKRICSKIEEKDKEIESLKAFVHIDTTEPASICFQEEFMGLRTELVEINRSFLSLNETFTSQQRNWLAENTELNIENTALRQRLSEFYAKNYENQIVSLKTELHAAIAQRNHAKTLIVHYIRNIQSLKSSIKGSAPQDQMNPEIIQLKEQNSSLLATNQDQEGFYRREIFKLQQTVDSQSKSLREQQQQMDCMRKKFAKENQSQIINAHKRLEILVKTNESIQTQTRIQESKSVISQYESQIQSLKFQIKTNKQKFEVSYARWIKERDQMKLQINQLRNKKDSDLDYKTTLGIIEAKARMLKYLKDFGNKFDKVLASGDLSSSKLKETTEVFMKSQEEFMMESGMILQVIKDNLHSLAVIKPEKETKQQDLITMCENVFNLLHNQTKVFI